MAAHGRARQRVGARRERAHHAAAPSADWLRTLIDLNRLARGLAHAFNTPLGTISAHAEEALALLDRTPRGRLTARGLQELREHLGVIMGQTLRCSRLATALLQYEPNRGLAGSPDSAALAGLAHDQHEGEDR